MNTSDPIWNLGLIGCGDIAPTHCKALPQHGYHLRAATSRTRARAESLVQEYGSEETVVCDSLETLLARDDLDCVLIATPPYLHTQQTIAALRAGKHVLCEKPFALTTEDCDAIQCVSEETGRKVISFSARLAHGGFTDVVHHQITSGALGEIYRVEVVFHRPHHRPGIDWVKHAHWFSDRRYAGGGVLTDMGQYLTEQVFTLFDWPVYHDVQAQIFRGFPHDLPSDRVHDVEEHANVFARLGDKGGIAYSLDLAARSHYPPTHRITILGSKAGLVIDHSDETNQFSMMFEADNVPGQRMEQFSRWKPARWQGDRIYRGFKAHILHGAPHPGTTIEQARTLIDFCHQAYISAAQLTS